MEQDTTTPPGPDGPAPPRNPFAPGAGHQPPYLAGREGPKAAFKLLLGQERVFKNLILTGLRGVGKTVLLDYLKGIAIQEKWGWASNEMSESACVSEEKMVSRILADLSAITSACAITVPTETLGFGTTLVRDRFTLDYSGLQSVYSQIPGLVADKLIGTLRLAWLGLQAIPVRGVVFAYDEAQNLSDRSDRDQYPMSVLLDVFQRLQREGLPYLLVLTGLPTLQARLVEARTYSERMFTTEVLSKLSDEDTREAIQKPLLGNDKHPRLSDDSVDLVVKLSGGYPYFIQFMCRDIYDIFAQQRAGGRPLGVPVETILRRLDTDFYAGRWALVSDRERDLLYVAATLPTCESEFTSQEIEDKASALGLWLGDKSAVNKCLKNLCELGLIYKIRHGRYTFGVPLLSQFILRQKRA
jgi:hypothetical protein